MYETFPLQKQSGHCRVDTCQLENTSRVCFTAGRSQQKFTIIAARLFPFGLLRKGNRKNQELP
ncbi:hypothetical protein [Thermanaeromonas toyohensis]|uniref:hypothetical protein n=1 Tax=Thermanaeromonas toyohensis TaxID=161154 RepID=UPI00155F925F|nr:hypothetical protein [Thermanaeromonas toyohensis]